MRRPQSLFDGVVVVGVDEGRKTERRRNPDWENRRGKMWTRRARALFVLFRSRVMFFVVVVVASMMINLHPACSLLIEGQPSFSLS